MPGFTRIPEINITVPDSVVVEASAEVAAPGALPPAPPEGSVAVVAMGVAVGSAAAVAVDLAAAAARAAVAAVAAVDRNSRPCCRGRPPCRSRRHLNPLFVDRCTYPHLTDPAEGGSEGWDGRALALEGAQPSAYRTPSEGSRAQSRHRPRGQVGRRGSAAAAAAVRAWRRSLEVESPQASNSAAVGRYSWIVARVTSSTHDLVKHPCTQCETEKASCFVTAALGNNSWVITT